MATIVLMETAGQTHLLGKEALGSFDTIALSPPLSACGRGDDPLADSAISVASLCGVLEHAAVDDTGNDDGDLVFGEPGRAADSFDSDDLEASSLLHPPSQRSQHERPGLRSASSAQSSQATLYNNDDDDDDDDDGDEDDEVSYMSLASSSSLSLSGASFLSGGSLQPDDQPTYAALGRRSARHRHLRPNSAPPGSFMTHNVPSANRGGGGEGFFYSSSGEDATYAGFSASALFQPAFPHVFDVFDYGDGFGYYLGGGGSRITRHLSRRQRRGPRGHHDDGADNSIDGFWPFEHPPLYACRLHHAVTGLPPVVLYGGPNAERDGPWADVQFGRFGRQNMTIGLPPLADHQPVWAAVAAAAAAAPATTAKKTKKRGADVHRADETLRVHLGWHNRYRFAIEVGTRAAPPTLGANTNNNCGAGVVREVFEWRRCSSAELDALDESFNPPDDRDEDDSEEQQQQQQQRQQQQQADGALSSSPTPRRGLGKVGAAVAGTAGRLLFWKKGGQGVDGNETKPTPKKRAARAARWRGGWQLVRLADSLAGTSGTLAAAATAPTAHAADPAALLLLDQLIGEEAGRAAERRRTPDGCEIVATWGNHLETDRKHHSPVSSTAATARFTFLGSGKSGQLGERWALMAVASGLAIWERGRRARRRRQSTVVQACGGLASIG